MGKGGIRRAAGKDTGILFPYRYGVLSRRKKIDVKNAYTASFLII
jgi:hypothetical protein